MKSEIKKLAKKATEVGATVDELIRELEIGGSNDLPFQLVVSFDRLTELAAFAKVISPTGIAVYRADSLDHEYGGSVPKNSFVMRSATGMHCKPDEWRV